MSKKRDREIRHEMDRRQFLKTCTCAALSAGAFSSTLANLRVGSLMNYLESIQRK